VVQGYLADIQLPGYVVPRSSGVSFWSASYSLRTLCSKYVSSSSRVLLFFLPVLSGWTLSNWISFWGAGQTFLI
jgi:hypothetical protein